MTDLNILNDADIAQIDLIEAAEIVAAEEVETTPAVYLDVSDIAAATAQAHGMIEVQAEDEAPAQAPAADEADAPRSFAELFDAVNDTDVVITQQELSAAFADRAAYERVSNPNNDNIQKTLSKVQRGHLAHGVSKAMRAIGLDTNYLNKSEVSGKRRNVYALEKLQDMIYGAINGHMKNAINIAVLVSMVKLERAQLDFTGAVAKACASDKMPIETHLKGLLRRHTVSESTASTQSSSTMTALEDLGAVVNLGSQKFPRWVFSDAPIAKRLREIVEAKHMPITV
jgi:hypothetical protein